MNKFLAIFNYIGAALNLGVVMFQYEETDSILIGNLILGLTCLLVAILLTIECWDD